MATFVHIFPAKVQKNIADSGIKTNKVHYDKIPKGVFCMPVIKDFYATHQWVRELMRGRKNMLAAYFRIPDDQEVWYGHFNKAHEKSAAGSVLEIFEKLDDKMGFQVILPRPVSKGEVLKIKKLPPLGWRYYPEAKGKKLTCFCPACLSKGEYGKRAMLEKRLDELEKEFFSTTDPLGQATAICAMSDIISDHKISLKSWREILYRADKSNELVLQELADLLLGLSNENATNELVKMLPGMPVKLQADKALSIVTVYEKKGLVMLGDILLIPEVAERINEYLAYDTE